MTKSMPLRHCVMIRLLQYLQPRTVDCKSIEGPGSTTSTSLTVLHFQNQYHFGTSSQYRCLSVPAFKCNERSSNDFDSTAPSAGNDGLAARPGHQPRQLPSTTFRQRFSRWKGSRTASRTEKEDNEDKNELFLP